MIVPRTVVTEQLSLILGAPVALTDAQVERFWAAFSREEELTAPKDKHGNVPPESLPPQCQGQQDPLPLHAEIQALATRFPAMLPRWPSGCRFAACLSHDVDRIVKLPWRERWRQLATLRQSASLKQQVRWACAAAVYAGGALTGQSDLAVYDPWMNEEARHGFHSTFFVLPEQLAAPTTHDHYYHYADPVRFRDYRMSFTEATRLAHEEGWEIGLHGSYASAFDTQIFRQDKAQVEEMLSAPIRSTRQHYLRFDVGITPHIQAQAGIQTDTTLGYSTTIGCRAGLAFPYFWPHEPELLEVPLIIQDVGLAALYGGDLARVESIEHGKALIRAIADAGGVVTLSWHTHPESNGAMACYRALLNTVAELGGWGCSVTELNDWWRSRRRQLAAITKKSRGTSSRS